MGATPRLILSIFIVQGMTIGFIGTALGCLAGVTVAFHTTRIVNFYKVYFTRNYSLPTFILSITYLLVCCPLIYSRFVALLC